MIQSTEPDISIVIPNYNGAATLNEQLSALTTQTYSGTWEIVIADNGSTDESPEIIRDWQRRHDEIRLIDASDKQGFAHASNAAAWAARGELLVFCDNDDVAGEGLLEEFARASTEYDIVSGWLDDELLNTPETRTWREPLPRDRLPKGFGFLPFAVAGNFAAKRSVFRTLDGWNESYTGGAQDVEFSWRAILAGHEIGYAPDAVMYYRYREGLGALGRQYRAWGTEEPHLYKDFRKHGMKRSNTRKALLDWAWIAWHVLDLRAETEKQGNWMRKAANRWGRFLGSIKQRVLYL